MERAPMTLERALALADHASPMPHDAGEALRCLREALLVVLGRSAIGVIRRKADVEFDEVNNTPRAHVQVSLAGAVPAAGDLVLILPWRADLGTPAALAKEIRDGNYSCP